MIRFAVIGQGHIGKRHAEMIRRNSEAELVAVCDILPPEATGCTDIEVPFYRSLEDLLTADLNIDVINICTPNAYHAPYAVRAMETGHHVVIEKPIALHRADAEQVIQKSRETNRRVFCVMQNRYSPPSVWLKDVIDKHLLGEIYMVNLNCFWNRDERYYKPGNWHGTQELDGGTLFTQYSHFIDIMYWLFGDIQNIQGNFRDFNHQQLTDFEDSGVVTFDFKSGGMGCLNYSTAVYDTNLESSMTILGQNGTIKVTGQYMNEVTYCHIKDYEMPVLPPCNPGNDYGAYKGSAQNHHYVIQNVVENLQGLAPIKTTVEEGTAVVSIIERIYEVRDKYYVK